jgi:hypothetical protein
VVCDGLADRTVRRDVRRMPLKERERDRERERGENQILSNFWQDQTMLRVDSNCRKHGEVVFFIAASLYE